MISIQPQEADVLLDISLDLMTDRATELKDSLNREYNTFIIAVMPTFHIIISRNCV